MGMMMMSCDDWLDDGPHDIGLDTCGYFRTGWNQGHSGVSSFQAWNQERTPVITRLMSLTNFLCHPPLVSDGEETRS